MAASEVAIITGAAGGLGLVYALALAAEGYAVVAADFADTAGVVSEIESAGGSAVGVQTDVSDESSTVAMAQAAIDAWGRIDVLVNNAAYYTAIVKKPFDELTAEEWTAASPSTSAEHGSAAVRSRPR